MSKFRDRSSIVPPFGGGKSSTLINSPQMPIMGSENPQSIPRMTSNEAKRQLPLEFDMFLWFPRKQYNQNQTSLYFRSFRQRRTVLDHRRKEYSNDFRFQKLEKKLGTGPRYFSEEEIEYHKNTYDQLSVFP